MDIPIKTIMKVEKGSDNNYQITFTIGKFPNRQSAGVFAAHILMAKDELLEEPFENEFANDDIMILPKRTLH